MLIEIVCNFAHGRRRASRLQRTGRTIAQAGSIVDDVALIDIARAGELRAAWASVNVALLVEGKVCA